MQVDLFSWPARAPKRDPGSLLGFLFSFLWGGRKLIPVLLEIVLLLNEFLHEDIILPGT